MSGIYIAFIRNQGPRYYLHLYQYLSLIVLTPAGPCFNIKTDFPGMGISMLTRWIPYTPLQPKYKDKTVMRLSYFLHWDPYTVKTTSLYWDSLQNIPGKLAQSSVLSMYCIIFSPKIGNARYIFYISLTNSVWQRLVRVSVNSFSSHEVFFSPICSCLSMFDITFFLQLVHVPVCMDM